MIGRRVLLIGGIVVAAVTALAAGRRRAAVNGAELGHNALSARAAGVAAAGGEGLADAGVGGRCGR